MLVSIHSYLRKGNHQVEVLSDIDCWRSFEMLQGLAVASKVVMRRLAKQFTRMNFQVRRGILSRLVQMSRHY